MIKKRSDGKWLLNIRLGGARGKQIKKVFRTQNEAKNFETWAKGEHHKNKAWAPPREDPRRLLDLINAWQDNHGKHLRAGEDTTSRLRQACARMGNPLAEKFSADMFAAYRTKRLAEGITANNMNREHAYLRAVFNECTRLDYWSKPNPMSKIRQIKISERELTYLSQNQISELLATLAGDAQLISKVCLATGARWSEAEKLRVSQVQNGQIQFTGTKSKKNRSVPIDKKLAASLKAHLDSNRKAIGRFFVGGYSAFRTAIKKIGLELPRGQMTHVLRHTFASHFMMNGGNILTLQKILGHQSLTMTMRYAHLAPEHLQEAVKLNPIAGLL